MSKKLPKATIIKGKKPAANENYAEFNDERTLAELIQNAAARGLHSVRGGLFGRPMTKQEIAAMRDDEDVMSDFECDGVEYVATSGNHCEDESIDFSNKRMPKAPKDSTCACALGAQLLSPRVTDPLTYQAVIANDAKDSQQIGDPYTTYMYNDERSMQIGAAYEQALRPE